MDGYVLDDMPTSEFATPLACSVRSLIVSCSFICAGISLVSRQQTPVSMRSGESVRPHLAVCDSDSGFIYSKWVS